MVEQALAAYDMLKEKGYEPTVVDMHTIKPIDEELLVSLAENHDLFVTCEEHSVIGGLGSAVAEVLGRKHQKDCYGRYAGYIWRKWKACTAA